MTILIVSLATLVAGSLVARALNEANRRPAPRPVVVRPRSKRPHARG